MMAKKRSTAIVIMLHTLMALFLVVSGSAQTATLQVSDELAQSKSSMTYIVWMSPDPVVAYDGGLPGLPATRPEPGQKVNPNAPDVRRYVAHLVREHERVLRAVGAGNSKLYDYTFSFNGFAATLSPAQAAEIAAMPDVITVSPDEARRIETDNSPDFLGLTDGGLWDELGGQGTAGEDVVIGIIDTGIWPEHASFSDDLNGDKVKDYGPAPDGWHGTCDAGEQFSKKDCNNKLIGARFFRLGAGAATVIPDDYLSPRDRDGHGTHTASTAGGNANVQASIFGVDRGTVNGIAPRARIAAYKVCWNDAGCYLSDIVKAIDFAVADGVDVINYSIGGGPRLLTSDTVAFLFAADAGVFVATSAGNSGPGAGSVGGPANVPWITAVGASTQDRTFQGAVELGSGASYAGASVTGGTDVLPLIDAADAGDELCNPGALDPALVSGKIVLCFRGAIARVEKSRAVHLAGGAGMVLYNTNDTEDLVTDNHWVPSVHITNSDGMAVKSYIAAEGVSATARILAGEWTPQAAPSMAAFSSRGPDVIVPDIIKPDITAPGVNILAGASPNPFLGAPGELFQAISGTSMSSPHVAGIFALLKQAHPSWTPEMAKSALMTTGSQDVMKEDGSTPADPFDMGGGHIAPTSAVDPGLVYDAGFSDYLSFLCGVGELSAGSPTCLRLGSMDPSDLNLASIAIADLAGLQTVTRTVTNVGPDATYVVEVEKSPDGIDVVVDPPLLELASGESANFSVTFTTTDDASVGEWSFGALVWSDGIHNVRSPLAVRPVALAAPAEVSGAGKSGSLSYDITFGYTGDFSAAPHGLVPAITEAGNVVDDPSNNINVALATGVGITVHTVTIEAGTEYARFSLFDDYTDGTDDLDLYVFGPSSAGYPFAGGSGSATSHEEVNVVAPAPGDYLVVVHGWQTDGPDANYTLFTWLLDAADSGNMTITAPAAAVLGGPGEVTVAWSGLVPDTKYLGSVSYHDVAAPASYNDGLLDVTIVRIDTD
jgi:subtilisin family serine protease